MGGIQLPACSTHPVDPGRTGLDDPFASKIEGKKIEY
jgi:hypothetical protein